MLPTISSPVERVVPWTTLLQIQARPRESKVVLPAPPKGKSRLPESFTLTARVQASGSSTSAGRKGCTCCESAKRALTLRAGLRHR